MSSFCNPLALKNLRDDDIDEIERSIRLKKYPELRKCENLQEIFGKELAADLSLFEFKRGDRVLIKEQNKERWPQIFHFNSEKKR